MADPDHDQIYQKQAEQYERLVSHEDWQHNLLPAIERIAPLKGLDVVELGAGTGRLTCMLAPVVSSIRAFDASPHMLDVAAAKLKKRGLYNWRTAVADHRRLPVGDRTADLVIAGWSVCYLVKGNAREWRPELDRALTEMKRVLRPGGTIVLLETLGTGYAQPHRLASLEAYYAFLEDAGFSSTWVRTDYRFGSLQEAVSLARFFFGPELAAQVTEKNWVILPECTGLWWWRNSR